MQQISLSRLPWWGQILAFVLLAVGGFYAVETYYISDMTAEIRQRQDRLTQLRADIARGLGTAKRLPEFRAQVADLERRLDSLKAVLPEQKDVGDLLRRIQTLATQSNLTIRGFTPRAIAQKQMHAEWPIGLSIEGTYHNLGLFFDRIGKFPRIINVTDLKIKANDKPGQNSTILADCTATTFVLMEQRPAAAGGRVTRPGAGAGPGRPGATAPATPAPPARSGP
ncbi:MAG TPA: type 4a pilus biogenesis protein PilO [Vicinamibacterales bacterium]|nr:type 4a pilus biogenesis protein PilO [Vicinamibacterales bacterium]